MAEVPGRVENIFINHEDNATRGISKNGIYALNLYALMMPIVVTIDDRLPQCEDNPYNTRMYARIGEDGSVWAPLLEKAMAYYHGTYEALDRDNVEMQRGWPENALNTLAGSPGKVHWHDEIDQSDLWDMLIELPDNAMLQSGIEVCDDEDDLVRFCENGLVADHTYTLLRPI